MLLITVTLLVVVFLIFRVYANHRHNYWASRGVPTFPGTSLITGHVSKLVSRKVQRWVYVDEIYKKLGGSTFCGYYEFFKPCLMIGDPDLIKDMSIKNFDHFVSRRAFNFSYRKDDVSAHFLLNATGSHWKGLRSVMSPIFTSGRLKGMYPLVEQKTDALLEYIRKHKGEDSSLPVVKTFVLFTTEAIAACAFGVDSGAFENEDAIFSQMISKFHRKTFKDSLRLAVVMILPGLAKLLDISIREESMTFFSRVVKDSIAQREAGSYQGDFLDLMMEAREDQKDPLSKHPKYPLVENDIVANSILFIIAGFSTSSSALSDLTFLLAKYPDVQEKLREEVRSILSENGSLNYQGIMESKFLEACLSETLRMYTPAHVSERRCDKEYTIPGTDVVIEKGTLISFPIFSIHHDERYWPEPYEYRPERFMPENKDDIKPGSYLGFGIGPRNCVGMRFAQMEIKLAIAKILLNFELCIIPGHEDLDSAKRQGRTGNIHVAFRSLGTED